MKAELWSWTAWLTLAIISYPVVLTVRLSPWAGLTGGAGAGAFLIARAGLGYVGRRDLSPWPRAVLIAIALAAAVGIIATVVDGGMPAVASIAMVAVVAEIMFAWHFLPAIVRDADTPEPNARGHFQLLPWTGRGSSLMRPSLGLALLLGFLMLGAGAMWHRAEFWAPDPAPWFVGVAILSFALMLVERLSFFERSSREGNLTMPAGSFSHWIAAALLVLLLAGGIAVIAPRRSTEQVKRASFAGSVAVPGAATGMGQQEGRSGSSEGRQSSPAGGRHRMVISLLLLLALLLLLILMWFFSRSRAARCLLALMTTALTRAMNAWRRFAATIRRWLHPEVEKPVLEMVDGDSSDPLLDPFENPDLLRTLSPRELLIRTYHLFLNFAEMLGYGRHVGQTPFEYARVVEAERPRARDGVRALTWGYAGAMYGGAEAALPDTNAIRLAWHQISDALTGDMPPDDLDLRRRAYLAARRLEALAPGGRPTASGG
jgi:hypothetical protein